MLIYYKKEDGSIVIGQTLKSHYGAIYDIDCYPCTESPYKFAFLTGSTDKTLRRWIVNVNSKDLT
jgi:WD40 repeat protein